MNQNKRIAEFMGLVVSDSANYTSELHTNVDVDLKYHTSWDWLMPVVSKIARDEEYFENEFSERLFDIVPFGRIEEVYEVVVEFIKIYNDCLLYTSPSPRDS